MTLQSWTRKLLARTVTQPQRQRTTIRLSLEQLDDRSERASAEACSSRRSLTRGLSAFITAIVAIVVVFTAAAEPARGGGVYTTLDYKPAGVNTFLTGIRGDYITGAYSLVTSPGTTHGLIYTQSTQAWTQYDVPPATVTTIYGPDPVSGGVQIVGSYKLPNSPLDLGFYHSTTQPPNQFTTIPTTNLGAQDTIAHSIFGSLVVGNYSTTGGVADVAPAHAFLWTVGSTMSTSIDKPGALSTTAYGIWQNPDGTVYVAGGYAGPSDAAGVEHAYLEKLSTTAPMQVFTTFDYPGATATHFNGLTGNGTGGFDYTGVATVDGQLIAFFFDGTTWTPLDYPGSTITSGNSVFDQTVVGVYMTDPAGVVHGYVATVVPEPSSLALLALGGVALAGWRRWKKRAAA